MFPRNSFFSQLTPGVINLVIINVLMFLFTGMHLFHLDFNKTFNLFYITSPDFRWWQVITSMFMHADFTHILFNMLGLVMFGPMLERVWGTQRFILYYMVCGIGGAFCNSLVDFYQYHQLLSVIHQFDLSPTLEHALDFSDKFSWILDRFQNPLPSALSALSANSTDAVAINTIKDTMDGVKYYFTIVNELGASGAVYGVLLGVGMVFPRERIWSFIIPFPLEARFAVFIYGAMELYNGFTNTESNIAHFAHLGGMLFGIILILIWNKTLRKNFY